jgi:hypothetical protein
MEAETRLREMFQGAVRFLARAVVPHRLVVPPGQLTLFTGSFHSKTTVRAPFCWLKRSLVPAPPHRLGLGGGLALERASLCHRKLACAATAVLENALWVGIHCAEHVPALHFS